MKALLSRTPGGVDTLTLEEVADPTAGPDQLVVRIAACGVNFPDALIIQDLYQTKPPRPFAPGGEVAGAVESVGDSVVDFRPGDRVIARTGFGGMAEKVAVAASDCVALPEGMSFEEGAALVFTYGTAIHALKQRAELSAGETLLVLGAAGGVGVAAIEIGKAFGARVVAAVSTEEKARFARDAGADEVVLYGVDAPEEDARRFGAELKSRLGPDGAHVILDPVGGPYAEAAFRSIAWGGRHLVVGFPAGIPRMPLNLPLLKGAQIVGVFHGGFLSRRPDLYRQNVAELLQLFGQGRIRPRVSAQYPLERAGEAIAALSGRTALGKVVVRIAEPA